MCSRCDAVTADDVAKAQAAYLANGYTRIRDAIRHEDQLAVEIAALILRTAEPKAVSLDLARTVIDTVREFDERTLAMRDAKDDHDQQTNEGRF